MHEYEVDEDEHGVIAWTYINIVIGIGSTLGAGVYVIAGQVAREKAGPAVVLSFLLAAVASWFAGLCYAEFGARVPRAGSAYVYTYTTIGEFCAFVIGWNLILEYVIGTATVARALSSYVDALVGNVVGKFAQKEFPMAVSDMASYPDFMALGCTLCLTVVMALGVKQSSIVNKIFTSVNLFVVVYVIVCGIFKADIRNWRIPPEDLPVNGSLGVGGFFPYGMNGVFSGAATCFYAFVGFDVIASAGEEVERPRRSVPLAILLCLAACCAGYIGVSTVMTLVAPYHRLDPVTPLATLFRQPGGGGGWQVASGVVAVGSVAGLTASLIGGMFPMPRILYAMASDGLLFRCLSVVNDRFKTPIAATFTTGTLAGVMATLFDTDQLVEMMSIGTLLAYTIVSICVMIIRHEPDDSLEAKADSTSSWWTVFAPVNKVPTKRSATTVKICVLLLSLLAGATDAILVVCYVPVTQGRLTSVLLLATFLIAAVILFVIIAVQPQAPPSDRFLVPFSPIVPALSVFANIYLTMKLSRLTWLRFSVWMVIGCFIYFLYGIRHSSLEGTSEHEDDCHDDDLLTSCHRGRCDPDEATRLLHGHSQTHQ